MTALTGNATWLASLLYLRHKKTPLRNIRKGVFVFSKENFSEVVFNRAGLKIYPQKRQRLEEPPQAENMSLVNLRSTFYIAGCVPKISYGPVFNNSH